jgi:hypothetical protein
MLTNGTMLLYPEVRKFKANPQPRPTVKAAAKGGLRGSLI